ncbi:putative secretory lipase [Apodospora peruviana]|uniref:Secretory lipase n=1 Tax=Apodospora peruviana TaxID=516989 RepID=A0AAE0IUF2_9PEZI|nr:putative secretory lipase [Apodospora peruviana]
MRSLTLTLLTSLFITLTNPSFATGTSTSTTCDPTCQAHAAAGSSYEASAHADPSYSFYTVPKNFSTSLPAGSLLGLELATNMLNYSIPAGLSMSRILYTTTDLNGTVLPTSAYILWPYSPLSKSGGSYPLVAWAHGTSGLFKACAPSNYRNLQYHFMAPFLLAMQGMVVVAPDYAGLGVSSLLSGQTIPHPWLAGPAQANDIANAITAARTAFPKVLRDNGPFVVMGHSQGGSAAWAFAERQSNSSLAIKGYKGTVAIAPPVRALEQYEQALADPSLPFSAINVGTAPKLIAAVTAAYPSYNYSGMTGISYDRWNNVLRKVGGCFPTDILVFLDVQIKDLAKQNWQKDKIVQLYAERTKVGGRKFKGPLLVVAADADGITSYDTVKTAFKETCAVVKTIGDKGCRGESLEVVTYKGVSHFPLLQASQARWLDWIKARLVGGTEGVAAAGCTNKTVEGVRQEFTLQSTLPNFLETWADPVTEGWKYVL